MFRSEGTEGKRPAIKGALPGTKRKPPGRRQAAFRGLGVEAQGGQVLKIGEMEHIENRLEVRA